jgi:two-component system response regulator PilR (NtrC family)
MAEMVSILVIDDEENLRRTLALILKREGYNVSTAASIGEARECLKVNSFNLAFLDLKLPDSNGLTFLPELRRDYPGMPVLILTAHDKLEAATEAVRKGARDYLLKPVDPHMIIQRVKEVLAEGDQPTSDRQRYTQLQKLLKDQRFKGGLEPPPSPEPKEP